MNRKPTKAILLVSGRLNLSRTLVWLELPYGAVASKASLVLVECKVGNLLCRCSVSYKQLSLGLGLNSENSLEFGALILSKSIIPDRIYSLMESDSMQTVSN